MTSTGTMNIRRVALMGIASLITASCSDKPAPDRNKNSSPDQVKLAPEEKRTKEPAPERSSKSEAQSAEEEKERERQPAEAEIAEDCVGFLRATKAARLKEAKADCPDCAVNAEGAEVLTFQQFQIDQISCSARTCEAFVTIRAIFNGGAGETITGGLTAWFSPEQRSAYLKGNPLPGQHLFRVKVVYRLSGNGWRAVEFDKADRQ